MQTSCDRLLRVPHHSVNDVAEGPDGRIYVVGKKIFLVFGQQQDAKLVTDGQEGPCMNPEGFSELGGIAFRSDRKALCTDKTNHQILVVNTDAEKIVYDPNSTLPLEAHELRKPSGLAVVGERVYVANTHGEALVAFDALNGKRVWLYCDETVKERKKSLKEERKLNKKKNRLKHKPLTDKTEMSRPDALAARGDIVAVTDYDNDIQVCLPPNYSMTKLLVRFLRRTPSSRLP